MKQKLCKTKLFIKTQVFPLSIPNRDYTNFVIFFHLGMQVKMQLIKMVIACIGYAMNMHHCIMQFLFSVQLLYALFSCLSTVSSSYCVSVGTEVEVSELFLLFFFIFIYLFNFFCIVLISWYLKAEGSELFMPFQNFFLNFATNSNSFRRIQQKFYLTHPI